MDKIVSRVVANSLVNEVRSQQSPCIDVPSIFLAGPTPRSDAVSSWRPDAMKSLREFGFRGDVFYPEPIDGWDWPEYSNQCNWELKCLSCATVILFWVPRDLVTMPAFTTNVEFGYWVKTGKCVLGHPEGAKKVRYLDFLYNRHYSSEVCESLSQTVQVAVALSKEFFNK